MKKLLRLVLLLSALPLAAQQATLTTPETITATKAVVAAVGFDRTHATITVELRSTDETVRRTIVCSTNGATEFSSFLTAIGTTRTAETGSVPRRMQFRVLGWLADNNRFADPGGNPIAVTVVP